MKHTNIIKYACIAVTSAFLVTGYANTSNADALETNLAFLAVDTQEQAFTTVNYDINPLLGPVPPDDDTCDDYVGKSCSSPGSQASCWGANSGELKCVVCLKKKKGNGGVWSKPRDCEPQPEHTFILN